MHVDGAATENEQPVGRNLGSPALGFLTTGSVLRAHPCLHRLGASL